MEKTIPTLPENVSKEYECIKVIPGEVVWKNVKIDLTKIDVATANRLVEEKFPYLVKKNTQTSSPASAKATGDTTQANTTSGAKDSGK